MALGDPVTVRGQSVPDGDGLTHLIGNYYFSVRVYPAIVRYEGATPAELTVDHVSSYAIRGNSIVGQTTDPRVVGQSTDPRYFVLRDGRVSYFADSQQFLDQIAAKSIGEVNLRTVTRGSYSDNKMVEFGGDVVGKKMTRWFLYLAGGCVGLVGVVVLIVVVTIVMVRRRRLARQFGSPST